MLHILFLVGSAHALMRSPQKGMTYNEVQGCSLGSQADMLQAINGKTDGQTDACEDFYQHACGGWMSAPENAIPSDRSSWGTFHALGKKNQLVVQEILSEKSMGAPHMYYRSCMDAEAIDKADKAPMEMLLRNVGLSFGTADDSTGSWTAGDYKLLQKDMCSMYMVGTAAFWSVGVGTVPDDPKKKEVGLSQGGLSLPRSMLAKGSSSTKHEKLKKHIADSFQLLEGGNSDMKMAADIVKLEMDIADVMLDEVSLRDPKKTFNPMSVASFQEGGPEKKYQMKFPWQDHLDCIYGKGKVKNVDVATPSYFNKIESVLESHSKKTVAKYLKWKVFSAHYTHLSKRFYDEAFSMSKALGGAEEEPKREEVCASRTEGAWGDYVSRAFVEKIGFDEQDRTTAKKMIHHIKNAFIKNLATNEWMTPETKAKAKKKCLAIKEKIGYPDYINNVTYLEEKYQGVTSEGAYFDNHMSSVRAGVQRGIKDLDKPVSQEWDMDMSTVNAYYDPSRNEIVFPSGILQAPFFNKEYHMAYNFGAIGVVMGHEMSHGFDDQGRLFDETGKMVDWWDKKDEVNFKARAGCISEQYGSYKVKG